VDKQDAQAGVLAVFFKLLDDLGSELAPRRVSVGRAKAAVLPVPVWEAPTTSFPVRMMGMDFAWISVGFS
jgi:hypothetical protein